jgi:putative acetyltransferase
MERSREERPGDEVSIRKVHEAAFSQVAEGRLVDRLRDDGLIVSSVVGVLPDGEIVASAIFSRVVLSTASGPTGAVALAPVAVTPAHQRHGFGSLVIRHGLRLCAQRGYEAAFVLGDPEYYSKFGFSSELAKDVSGPYSDAGPAWMALHFNSSAPAWERAEVRYPDAFSIVD